MTTNERFRQFELECSIKCQTCQLHEFCDWLRSTYNTQHEFLTSYAVRKINLDSTNSDINLVIIEITNYIYNLYTYNHSTNLQEFTSLEEADSNSELDDLPELIDIEDNIVHDLTSIMVNLRNMDSEEVITDEMMRASLINDYTSALLFQEMFTRIREERLLQKKFNIESVIELDEISYQEEKECDICFDSYKKDQFVSFNCKHEFCKTCVKKSIESDKRPHPCCGYCRTKICKMTSRTIEVQLELSELII